ncbi:hypothetical protein AK830_g7258 [Neonectria ditissima]|uniref:Transcription factor domain-containing protein n=1 Tax=Neonectria ditissima TaxID=78410 RepID=A0A0P7BFE6_9HYPO|nr:hypothetical protein AK830_g7258 [Neonectria ditissima]
MRNSSPLQFDHCIPPTIPEDVESNALGFFFLRYSFNHDVQTTCSFFGILPAMYANSNMSFPLAKATTALALQVARLHSWCGDESTTEHRVYTEALTQTNQAIAGATQSKSDELLMTTLVLDAYESNRATFGREDDDSRFGTHILGSVALLQHRGSLNYRDEVSWRLVIATRNRLLYQNRNAFTESAGLEAVNAVWDGAVRTQPQGVAIEADTLTFKLSRLQHLLETNRQTIFSQGEVDDKPIENSVEDEMELGGILASASNLAIECDLWRDALPPIWEPMPVLGCTLAPSIQAVALYDKVMPAVYTNLLIANSLNRQRITELGVLALIQECLVATSAKDAPRKSQSSMEPPAALLARAQLLVDEICASVPYLTVDVTDKVYATSPALPTPSRSVVCHWDTAEHRRQVIASGLYMMYGTLDKAVSIVGDGGVLGGLGHAILRDGQVDWMIEQSHRLRNVLRIVKDAYRAVNI